MMDLGKLPCFVTCCSFFCVWFLNLIVLDPQACFPCLQLFETLDIIVLQLRQFVKICVRKLLSPKFREGKTFLAKEDFPCQGQSFSSLETLP